VKQLRLIFEDEPSDPLSAHYNYSSSEKKQLRMYSVDSSINNDLWNKHQHKHSVYSSHRVDTAPFDSIVNKHKTPHALTLYSSSRHDPENLKNSEGIVHHPAYLSASTDKNVAHNMIKNNQYDARGQEHQHIYKIHVQPDTLGPMLGNIAQCHTRRNSFFPEAPTFVISNHPRNMYQEKVSGMKPGHATPMKWR